MPPANEMMSGWSRQLEQFADFGCLHARFAPGKNGFGEPSRSYLVNESALLCASFLFMSILLTYMSQLFANAGGAIAASGCDILSGTA